jgi:RNA recognition motif-containing protein
MMSTEQDLKVHNKELISKKIFVGNIPLQATNNDLATLMSRFGEIDIAYIIHDNQT